MSEQRERRGEQLEQTAAQKESEERAALQKVNMLTRQEANHGSAPAPPPHPRTDGTLTALRPKFFTNFHIILFVIFRIKNPFFFCFFF